MLRKSLAALGLLLAAFAQTSPSREAKEQLADLRQQAIAARKSGDKQARLAAVLKIERLLNGEPHVVANLAQIYAAAGDTDRALAAVSQIAALGQADDGLLQDPAIAALNKSPQFVAVMKRFAENKMPVSRATTAFVLAGPRILAEDIDYDPHSKSFLITSVLEDKIIRVTREGKATDFAQSPSRWPMLAIKVDAPRDVVWATEVAMEGFASAPKSDWGRSALVCFDLHSGKLLRRIAGPAKSALGDIALTAEGDAIVSDGAGGGVYRARNVAGGQLQRIDGGDFLSPQTPAIAYDGKHVFVPDYARGIALLDPATKQVQWLDGEKKYALNGIDGLYYNHNWLIATQNGSSPERVIRFRLDPTQTRIMSEEIIERATPTLGDPTHGVVLGDDFYYIANSGWSELDEHGNVKAGSKLSPARVMRFKLR
ncbi:MAG: hypothetical protein ABI383_05180 [Acidobacteriaceae bacterium]